MDKNSLLKLLLSKEDIRTYGYNVGFFIVFSFFLIFAIRPNLVTAFNLQKELQELKLKDKQTEEVILQVVSYQSTLEEYRDKLPLLDQAVPSAPTIAQVIDEVRKSASDSGILINVLSVESIDLKGSSVDKNQDQDVVNSEEEVLNENENPDADGQSVTQAVSQETNSFTIDMNGTARANEVSTFLNKLMNQRRLKKIDSVSLVQEENGSTSILLSIYYL
ncbi:MAG: hypothetical protein O3B87_00080 [bacterium]|nr:hypothetical protein [bacterium]